MVFRDIDLIIFEKKPVKPDQPVNDRNVFVFSLYQRFLESLQMFKIFRDCYCVIIFENKKRRTRSEEPEDDAGEDVAHGACGEHARPHLVRTLQVYS